MTVRSCEAASLLRRPFQCSLLYRYRLGFGVRGSCFKSVAHPQSFRLVVRSRVVWGNQCVFNPCELAKFARWLSQRHTTWNTCVVLMTMFRRITFQCVPLRGQNDLKMALNLEILGDEERMRKKQGKFHDTIQIPQFKEEITVTVLYICRDWCQCRVWSEFVNERVVSHVV